MFNKIVRIGSFRALFVNHQDFRKELLLIEIGVFIQRTELLDQFLHFDFSVELQLSFLFQFFQA